MSFLKTIIIVGFGMMLINCGGQNNNDKQGAVEIDRVEADGTARAKDGRIVLGSQSEDHLIIPEGAFEGFQIDSTKLANAIVGRIDSVSRFSGTSVQSGVYFVTTTPVTAIDRVSGISLQSGVYFDDFDLLGAVLSDDDPYFTTSFSVITASGEEYHGIECQSQIDRTGYHYYLQLFNCDSDQVVVHISTMPLMFLASIVVNPNELSAKVRSLQKKDRLK